jgi:bacillithiol system protein YtxJ
MSIFSTIFGSSDSQEASTSNINWIPLEHLGQLDELVVFSNDKPAVIFKHSTRCSVSRFALKQFENEFDIANQVDTYFLDLLEHRDISNEIASRFGVYHQSPQMIVIKEGKAIYDASHSDISAIILKEKL